ncbi:MAG: hypothetical protein PUA84_07665 [Oscillospiraceae bacterium]|nr:hypothetical protein [Oscillospiraceae bacterium]
MAEQREENKTEMAQQTASAENGSTEKEKILKSKRRIFYIAPQKRGQALKILIVSALALVLFYFVINSYVQLNEVYSDISSASTTLNELRSDNVRMQTELEGQASIRNIKEYAEERLGLKKMDQSQIQYIQIQTEDEVIVEEPEKNIFIKIKSWFIDLIEYLRG